MSSIKPQPPAQTVVTQEGNTSKAIFPRLVSFSVTETIDGRVGVTDGETSVIFPNHNPLTISYKGSPPKCPAAPPVVTRTVQCPVGFTGSWTQTEQYTLTPAPGCWQPSNPPLWLPETAPAGACVPVTPPPSGEIDLSYVDKTGTAYATFKHWVDAHLTAPDYLQGPTDFAYMAKLDGGAQYKAAAIAAADAYATKVEAAIAAGGQPNWGADANGSDGISSDSYLNVGTHLRDFALTIKWCSPSPSQIARWTAIMTQAVYNVWNPTLAKWGGRSYPWSGWAINDPGDNYFYSFTLATMMYQWVTGDAQYAARTWPVAAAYFATIPTGGSEEGTGYGTSHKGLFEDMRFERDLFGEDYTDAHLTSSIYYWVHATTPDFQHFAAIGDQSRVSYPTWFDYQRALVAQAMALTTDATAKAQGSWLLHHVTPQTMQYAFDYRDGLLPTGNGGTAPTALSYFASSTGDLFARTDWTASALWVAFRAGKYDQSHAHQDQGAFQCYANGAFLAVDESVFSHSGIQQDVTNNNTLRFVKNGAVSRQVYGSASSMTVTGSDPASGIHAVANLAPAAGAAVSAWTRKFDFVGRTVTITDAYTPTAGYAGIFQVSAPVAWVINGKTATAGALTLTVLSPADAVLSALDWTTVMNGPTKIDPKTGKAVQSSDYGQGWRLDVSSATNAGYTVQLTTTGN